MEDVGGRRPGARRSRAALIDFTLNRYYQGKLRDPSAAHRPHHQSRCRPSSSTECCDGLAAAFRAYACRERHTSNHAGHRPAGGHFKANDGLSGLKVLQEPSQKMALGHHSP